MDIDIVVDDSLEEMGIADQIDECHLEIYRAQSNRPTGDYSIPHNLTVRS